MFSCFCIPASCIELFFLALFFTHSSTGSPVSLKVRRKSLAPFEVSVRDIGSNCRKKRISRFPDPNAIAVCFAAPEPFVLFSCRDLILCVNKAWRKPPPLQSHKMSEVMFCICLSDNKREMLHFLFLNGENYSETLQLHHYKFSYRL